MNDTNSAYLEKHRDILSFRDLSPHTVDIYSSCLSAFLNWMETELPDIAVADVSWEQLRSYFRMLKDVRHLNSKTVNIHISQLASFFKYVLHRDWDSREVPPMKVDEKLPVVPTPEEVNTIIDSIENRKHKAMIALLYSSGIRVSELCRLRCGDIHVSEHYIFISKSKNRSERRAILSEKALAILTDYVRADLKGAVRDDWLFPGQKPDTHVCTETVRRVFCDRLVSLGWQDKGFNLHSLRHAFGLHLYNNGTDIMAIKEAMGHRSLSSTTIYLTLGIGNGRSVISPYDCQS